MGSWAQLDSGQKKSVLTTPHFVLPDTADTLEWIVKYFVRFAVFRSHTLTQSLLLSFNCDKRLHNTMSICEILEWTKRRNMKRMRMERYTAPPCHVLCCCRCGDRWAGSHIPGSCIHTIYTLPSQWQQETGDITIVFTQYLYTGQLLTTHPCPSCGCGVACSINVSWPHTTLQYIRAADANSCVKLLLIWLHSIIWSGEWEFRIHHNHHNHEWVLIPYHSTLHYFLIWYFFLPTVFILFTVKLEVMNF